MVAAVDASLQNKVNLLGMLLIAFALLAIPVFTQVKADTLDSVKQAPDTLLSQWSRDMAQNFRPDDVSDIEVEDAWYDRARQENPDCGPACAPEGDPDGDGVTNQEELENGTNPMCNENEYGDEYCAGVENDTNVTKPDDPNATQRYEAVLYQYTWEGDQVPEEMLGFDSRDLQFDYFIIYMNATWGSAGYNVEISDEEGAVVFVRSEDTDPLGTGGGGQEAGVAEKYDAPLNGSYTVTYGSGGFTLGSSDVEVELMVLGVIEPKVPAA
jgi:hypothetical protein